MSQDTSVERSQEQIDADIEHISEAWRLISEYVGVEAHDYQLQAFAAALRSGEAYVQFDSSDWADRSAPDEAKYWLLRKSDNSRMLYAEPDGKIVYE